MVCFDWMETMSSCNQANQGLSLIYLTMHDDKMFHGCS